MFRIREVDGFDQAEILTELHHAAFEDSADLVDFADGWWWVAFNERVPYSPAGFIGMKAETDCTAYFIRVGVDPDYRGHGLQRRLMRAMHIKARKLCFWNIITDTRDNPHSANNLIAAGYRTFSPSNPWAHRDAVYWTKDL
ncbi:GNAT family N-acetyltransferase [Bradyrhizobium sp. 139]|uniref:GNAT family N-acetyltransferase n=1 Tax=Bradyrhizobium sp. 139 TaxID=2782616 RepID=UPI001FFB21CE|nr:GNAT family N-acetyltransferase [Bradyrhizobium sp. 139]MCK1742197.1 GNAT family N-acetyltransferase [Bradyrhizobium sp. 139]